MKKLAIGLFAVSLLFANHVIAGEGKKKDGENRKEHMSQTHEGHGNGDHDGMHDQDNHGGKPTTVAQKTCPVMGIDGRTFEMNDYVPKEIVNHGALEAWEFVNEGGRMGMMGGAMQLPHPMHLHGVQFQIIERFNDPYPSEHVDVGWKDTILVMPGERVRFLVRFADFDGLYVYHCHNLEHEDMGMMRNFFIKKTG